MTQIGEETGNLEKMLVKVAEYYEEDVETATASLLAALEPMIIIVLALTVGVILAAIFQPMMSIYSAVEGM
jgi:type IV pilus assembly protein PilC